MLVGPALVSDTVPIMIYQVKTKLVLHDSY